MPAWHGRRKDPSVRWLPARLPISRHPAYVNYILSEVLRWHVTSLNVKWSAIPAEWKPALPPGEYSVRVAMLDKRTRQPAIALGMAGRTPEGWYDIGKVQIRSR